MKHPVPSLVVIVAALLFSAGVGFAKGSTYAFDLTSESSFETGCFAPCACPVLLHHPVDGTLTLLGSDVIDPETNLVDHSVRDVRWAFKTFDRQVTVRGSGSYQTSSISSHHRMQLDLSVDGGPIQHFDSGLVPRARLFPEEIAIDISLHHEFCWDSVFRVRAQLRNTGVGDQVTALVATVQPNPFSTAAQVQFRTLRAGTIDVRVHDVAGRELAVLARGWRIVGPVSVAWDGHRSDGSSIEPGLYFVKIVAAGRRVVLPVVRLR